MKKGIKSKKGIVITIILIAVLIVGAVAGYFIYRNYSWKKSYDVETGMIVKNRVAKAQYLPNLNLLVGRSHSSINSASNSAGESYCMTDLAFTLNDYKKIERELAAITGSSTRLDTSIEEIKKEIYTVLDLVPVFDKWFRLPYFSDEENGYYSNYYYKLTADITFAAHTKYTYNISVKKTGLVLTSTTITDWLPGTSTSGSAELQ